MKIQIHFEDIKDLPNLSDLMADPDNIPLKIGPIEGNFVLMSQAISQSKEGKQDLSLSFEDSTIKELTK